MARGRMRLKYADLVESLTGQFDDHHAELARMLLHQIGGCQVFCVSRDVDLGLGLVS
jgi:hypothetical protein